MRATFATLAALTLLVSVPGAQTKPAAPAQSNTIHAPVTTPAPNTVPDTSADTPSGTSSDDSRAAPAQLATATPDTHSSPAETIADEPKPG